MGPWERRSGSPLLGACLLTSAAWEALIKHMTTRMNLKGASLHTYKARSNIYLAEEDIQAQESCTASVQERLQPC